jgi:putative transposase
VKLAFIRAEKASFPIAAMCRLLGVTRQAYYASLSRKPSTRLKVDADLCVMIREIFVGSRGRYGSPRVYQELRRRGVRTSKRSVERWMRGMGLTPPSPRRHRRTTVTNSAHPVAANTLARDFNATRPNERWVTDITYVWTAEGWAYVAVILDLFSRAVVGWALSESLATSLPLRALRRAVESRGLEDGSLLHHSDRGCQYTSAEYRRELAARGIDVSMSRRGNCWDNAVAESFFATLKSELVSRRDWNSRIELREALFEYLDGFYNHHRLHSTLNYKTPAEVERDFVLAA